MTEITVTNMGKQQKDGLYQVIGFRTADVRYRMVTFWVHRHEAEVIARALREGEVIVEVDDRAWVHILLQAAA